MQFMQSAPTMQTQLQCIVVQDMDQQVGMQQLSMQQLTVPTVPVVQQSQAQSMPAHLQLDQMIQQIPDASAQRTVYTAPIPTTSQSVQARTLIYAPMQLPTDARAASGGRGRTFLRGPVPTPAPTPRYTVRPALGASLQPVQGQGTFGQRLVYADTHLQFRKRGRRTGMQMQGLQSLTQQRSAPTGQSDTTGSQPSSSQTCSSHRSRSRSPHK